ncbi:nitrogen fixation protein NifQ [Pandoraea sp. ISTKB]|uniref:nitrogen fixation protein NifQ n=1 Tax=Pandoraea sp. ISTKB TaxID=1586708 RepID=UPI0009F19E17|nr:nitrogen fixation protein NifQ [Pandoraea sp. ISTKB]
MTFDLVPSHTRQEATLFATLLVANATPERVARLGLSGAALTQLLRRHFSPVSEHWQACAAALPTPAWASNAMFVVEMREMLRRRADPILHPMDAADMATILATACLRPDHLWRDLGLTGRDDVTALLTHFFPSLVLENTENLRWKRFLAQVCAQAYGRAPAPAPGCPGCEAYGECYAHLREVVVLKPAAK